MHPSPNRQELHVITDEDACRLVDERLGRADEWRSKIISYRLESPFQAHWKAEIGHWIATAERTGYADQFLAPVISRSKNDARRLPVTRELDDPLYRFMLAELAPGMFAHYMLATGWKYRHWALPASAGGDVDLGLWSPDEDRLVDVQIKAPGTENPFGALTKAARQLSTSLNRTLIALCSRDSHSLAGDPDDLLAKLLGNTTIHDGVVRLTDRGAFATPEWINVGGVAFLNYIPGVDSQAYACSVVLNPWARQRARVDRRWFARGRVLGVDGNAFRWTPNAPEGSSYFPEGTHVPEELRAICAERG